MGLFHIWNHRASDHHNHASTSARPNVFPKKRPDSFHAPQNRVLYDPQLDCPEVFNRLILRASLSGSINYDLNEETHCLAEYHATKSNKQ